MKNKLESQLVSFEIAKLLKDINFCEPCFGVYDEKGFIQDENEMDELELAKTLAPLWQQADDFILDKYNIHIIIWNNASGYGYELCKLGGTHICMTDYDGDNDGGMYDTTFKAREQAILKAIEIIKNK